MARKAGKPAIYWKLDAGFYSTEITVKARTQGEARKKAMEKLRKKSAASLINPSTTYLDKM